MSANPSSFPALARTLAALALVLPPMAVSSAFAAEPAPTLETVAVVDYETGNIAVAPDGTIVLSIHSSLPGAPQALILRDGVAQPLPDPATGKPALERLQGMRADRDGLVWMVSSRNGQHLYAWDLAENRLAHQFDFDGPPAVNARSSFNDIALAPDHGVVFVTDISGNASALLAVDIATGNARRLLEGHPSMQAEAITAVIDGKAVGSTGPDGEFRPFRAGLNPVTIDAQEQWVYYGALAGRSVYRVRVDDLLDESLDARALGEKVEFYAAKVPSAGITIDDAGNIYVTDIQAKGIGVAAPGRDYRLLVSDPQRLDWPDGITVGADGYVYTNANHLQRNFPSHRDIGPAQLTYYVTRFKALAGTTVGR